jgi:hypothetical protein
VELQFFASVRESEQRKLKTTGQPHLNCIDFGRKALSQKTEDRKFSATDVSGQQMEHLTKGPGDGVARPYSHEGKEIEGTAAAIESTGGKSSSHFQQM